ncbi:hypothetical protein KCP75_19365 [Salmonella enterica subsp. enterica]|nr:hypothetical protein KCP75_19365 [Salmonella enterica subsp. enterica]
MRCRENEKRTASTRGRRDNATGPVSAGAYRRYHYWVAFTAAVELINRLICENKRPNQRSILAGLLWSGRMPFATKLTCSPCCAICRPLVASCCVLDLAPPGSAAASICRHGDALL